MTYFSVKPDYLQKKSVAIQNNSNLLYNSLLNLIGKLKSWNPILNLLDHEIIYLIIFLNTNSKTDKNVHQNLIKC